MTDAGESPPPPVAKEMADASPGVRKHFKNAQKKEIADKVSGVLRGREVADQAMWVL